MCNFTSSDPEVLANAGAKVCQEGTAAIDGVGGLGAKLAAGASISFSASLIIQLLSVVTGILLARNLGPSGKGELAAAMVWAGLVTMVFELGLFDGVTFYAGRLDGRERQLFATSLYVSVALALLAALAGYYLLGAVLAHAGTEALAAARLYLLWIPVNFAKMPALAILQGKSALRAFNLVRLAVIVWSTIGLLALAAGGVFEVRNCVLVYVLANALALGAAWTMLGRAGWLGWTPDRLLVRPLLSYGIKSNVGNLSSLANQRADQLLISAFLAPAELGLYTVAVTLTSGIMLVGTSVQIVTFPLMAQLRDRDRQARVLGSVLRLTLLASLVLAVGFIVATPLLIELFFGSLFLPAISAAQLLLVAAVVLSFNLVLAGGLRGCGWPLGQGVAEIAAVAVTLASLWAFLPLMGIVGAAAASLLAYGTSTAVMLWVARQRLGLSLKDLLVPARADLIRDAHAASHSLRIAAGWLKL